MAAEEGGESLKKKAFERGFCEFVEREIAGDI